MCLGGGSSASSAAGTAAADENAISNWLFKYWKQEYKPVEQSLVTQAELPTAQQPGYLGAVGQINSGYNNMASDTRRMSAGAYNYGSGLTDQAMSTANLNRVRDLATAYQNADSQRFSNLLNVANIGRGYTNQAQSGLAQGANTDLGIANLQYRQSLGSAQALSSLFGSLGTLGMMGLGGLGSLGSSGSGSAMSGMTPYLGASPGGLGGGAFGWS